MCVYVYIYICIYTVRLDRLDRKDLFLLILKYKFFHLEYILNNMLFTLKK